MLSFSAKKSKKKLAIAKIAKLYSSDKTFLATSHFLSLALSANPILDPILKQVLPADDENIEDKHFIDDPLCEDKFSPLPHLVRRYKDRALIHCTNRCFIHCRFCFRKRFWFSNSNLWNLKKSEFVKIAKYISSEPQIKEVILSGGDPLCLDDDEIFYFVEKIDRINSVEVIRLASRALSAYPARITAKFAKGLKMRSQKIWFMSHFNHPAELSDAAKIAISHLIYNGIPILNQTVLLRGINDNFATLSDLFRGLVSVKVKPHYLFHVDPAKGNKKFVTGIKAGIEIMRRLRKELSSICVPDFALDLPDGGGKIVLAPELLIDEDRCSDYDGKNFRILS